MKLMGKAEKLLSEMENAEKVQLLKWLILDLTNAIPGIEVKPGVCGGAPRILGTRIPVWTLVQFRKLGASEIDILQTYPTLQAEDLVNAWAYFRSHKSEIEQQIIENETA